MEMDPEMEIQVAAAKVSKYAVGESGDTVELIERPFGGLSLVLVDGQRSGKSAKAISNIVARKAVSLLADGVRDGAAARAAHDYLRTMRGGQVSATLDILSVDLGTRTIVVSRNSHCPTIVVRRGGSGPRCGETTAGGDGPRFREDDAGGETTACGEHEFQLLEEPSEAIGIHPRTRPVIVELPITLDLHVVTFTDGLLWAGERYGERLDALAFIREQLEGCYGAQDGLANEPVRSEPCARRLADALLARAVALDRGRPTDDISVVVLSVVKRSQPDEVRRLSVRFPL
jgi:serine phosphatase RsbU (regulator of sigma subunit)